jgi:hypothetical protein
MQLEKAAKMTFVRKIRAFNVDEIDICTWNKLWRHFEQCFSTSGPPDVSYFVMKSEFQTKISLKLLEVNITSYKTNHQETNNWFFLTQFKV